MIKTPIKCECGKIVLVIEDMEITNINKAKIGLSRVVGEVIATCKCGKKTGFAIDFSSVMSII